LKPLRVALVHPFAWPEVRRGGERYVHDLGWYLSEAGHEVHLITGTYGSPSVTFEAGVTTHRLRHRTRMPGTRRSLRDVDTFGLLAMKALTVNRYDLVHALTPTAAVGARLTGHRVVYTLLGNPTMDQFIQRGGLAHQYFRGAVRLATAVTALSHSAARQTRELTGRLPEILPPGLRLDHFTPNLKPRVGPPLVLFPADASETRKGVDVTLAAVARLLHRRPDVRLLLAGPGDHAWATRGEGPHGPRSVGAPALAVTDVLGVGELSGMPARYRDATLTVLPSLNEAFGLVLAESMACGTPVVGSSAGGISDVVDRPEVGTTAPYGDAGALADALDKVIDLAADPATPTSCAKHARRWDWKEVIGPAHENLYADILPSSRPSRVLHL
jgi:phosphatidylinositol alpha-mannosyltransferase